MEAPNTTIAVQRYLDDLAVSGKTESDPLIHALLARSVDRLRMLCGQLLYRSYPRLTRGPAYLETDDLLGAVVARLLRALNDVKPGSVRQFFALANKHIRWELNDLARRIDHQAAVGGTIAHLTGDPPAPPPPASPSTHTPAGGGETATLLRILAAIDALPDEEREVFEFVRIQGMTHPEAAKLLDVSEKTIQRRLRRSVLLLSESLGDLVPAAGAAIAGDGVEPHHAPPPAAKSGPHAQ